MDSLQVNIFYLNEAALWRTTKDDIEELRSAALCEWMKLAACPEDACDDMPLKIGDNTGMLSPSMISTFSY